MFSYYQIDPASLNKCDSYGDRSSDDNTSTDAAKATMEMTLFFASTKFSVAKFVFTQLPKKPPDGIVTEIIMAMMITAIFSFVLVRAYTRCGCE